jgi:hypothetical protein
VNCHKTENPHKQTTNNSATMCFHIPFFAFFFKKKDILGDDDGSTSPMPSHGGHYYSFCIDDRCDIVAESLTFNDDDDDDDGDDGDDSDDDDDVVFINDNDNNNNNKPRPPSARYHAMVKREKERHLHMEFLDMYLVNQKKDDDHHCRILDMNSSSDGDGDDDRDDRAFTVVDANAALLERQASSPIESSFGAVRVPFGNDGSVSSVPELVFRTDEDWVYLTPNDDGHVMDLLKDCARSLVAGCDEESVADKILYDEVLFDLLDRYNAL